MPRLAVSRASLGRAAKLGALYDVRTETILHDNLFVSELEDDMVDNTDLAETVIEMTMSDSLQEKCKKLNVEAELEVSVLAGMVKLGGSGVYLEDERKSARAQRMSLIYKLKTINEEVIFSHTKDIIDKDILSDTKPDATHVVVGIDWGTQCTITCEYENTENDDVTTVGGEMSAELQRLKALLNVKEGAKVDFEDKGKDKKTKFSFKCWADVSAPDKDFPVTYEGAVELARSIPTLVKNTNDGKGVPVTYYLMPLETVRKKCKVKSAVEMIYKEVDEDTVRKCAQVLEKIKEKSKKVYDIHHDMEDNRAYISNEALGRVDEVWGGIIVQESRFKSDLQKVVKRVRSGKDELSALEEVLGERKPEDFSASQYEEEFEPYLTKVRLIRSMLRKEIKYIGKKDELVKDAKQNTFVFYITKGSDMEVLEKNRDFLMRLSFTFCENETFEFIVVDQETVSSHVWPDKVKKATIKKYKQGICTSEDLYEEEGQYLGVCMIQVVILDPKSGTPRKRTFARLRCPNAIAGNGSCTGDPSKWRCWKCKQMVEYGTSSKMFYCKCGKSNPGDSQFRCSDPHHGMNFMKYPKDLLSDELSNLEAMKEVNVLVLGETGVGKSTWINGVQNYLSFANLTEAMNSQDFPVLIPSSFTLTQDGKQREIKVGIEDPNEVQETGKSATKEPRSYIFTVGDRRLCLIDTPGIGDSGGIKQDEINMNNILSYLTYYSEINAICILLKPNNARLTAMFRFCIQELLVQLHNSAKDNIVFCFTNARQTFYQPGDTLPALNKELENRNVGIKATKDKYFCFDNEPFRFLACIKNGVTFGEGDISTYSSSWDKSVEETVRLLNYIECDLKPHKVRETLGMNEARRRIIAMSKPLAEVANTINHNLEAAKETKTKIGLVDTEIHSLKEELKFKGYDIERKELHYHRTVCAAPECVKYVPVGQTKVQNTIYEQICHSRCQLKGVPIETTGNEQLSGCWAMTSGYCHLCKHSYKQHMHLTYELEITEREFLSPQIQDQISQVRDKKSKIQAFKDEINKKVEELKAEQEIIVDIAAKFGSFLQANALIPYNDAVDDYLEMCIKQERAKPVTLRNEGVLENMTKMKEEYNIQRKILDNAIDKGAGENIETPEQVKELQEKLFKLRHFGVTLKKLFEEISIDRTAKYISFEEKIVPPRKRAKGQKTKGAFDRLSAWWHRR